MSEGDKLHRLELELARVSEALKRIEPTVERQGAAIQEMALAHAKSNEARVHVLNHIDELRAWKGKVMWWIIGLLVGMVGLAGGLFLKG